VAIFNCASAGGGDDTIVVVGEIEAEDYEDADLAATAAEDIALGQIITNAKNTTDVTTDEYDGGAGTDTLEIWGTADFTSADIDDIEVFDVHSDVTFTWEQLVGVEVQTITSSKITVIGTGDDEVYVFGDEDVYGDDDDYAGDLSDGTDGLQHFIDNTISASVPVANDDTFDDIGLNATRVFTIDQLIANDDIPEDADVELVDFNDLGTDDGTVEFDEDAQTLTFTPAAVGEASFSYTISDGDYESEATVSFNITEVVTTDPVAVNDTDAFTVEAGASIDIDAADLLANDSDADGDELTITAVNDQGNVDDGTTVLSEDGTIVTFTAAEGYEGDAAFAYMVSDGNGGTATAMVNGTVTAAGGYTEESADIGTATVAGTLDASTDGFMFTDDASVLNNVEITSFTADDIIEASNAVDGDYSFTNTGADVSITFNNAGTLNTISLIGVVDASDLVYDEASFETAIGFDAFTIA